MSPGNSWCRMSIILVLAYFTIGVAGLTSAGRVPPAIASATLADGYRQKHTALKGAGNRLRADCFGKFKNPASAQPVATRTSDTDTFSCTASNSEIMESADRDQIQGPPSHTVCWRKDR
jgi:hypothetical protein